MFCTWHRVGRGYGFGASQALLIGGALAAALRQLLAANIPFNDIAHACVVSCASATLRGVVHVLVLPIDMHPSHTVCACQHSTAHE